MFCKNKPSIDIREYGAHATYLYWYSMTVWFGMV